MSIKDTAQSIIKSINSGDTLTSVSLGAENFHSDTVKLVSVLVGKKLGGIYVTTSRPSSHIRAELEEAGADLCCARPRGLAHILRHYLPKRLIIIDFRVVCHCVRKIA